LEESLWISGTKKTNYQTLEKDEKADVCVIGGGIVGAITAYLLTKKGLNVIVLEKDKLCMGVTANSTAKLTSQHGLFYKYLYDEYGADFAKLYLESNENGIKLAEEIIQNENNEDHVVITIAREYGSGGRYIGKLVAKKLGIKLYDKSFVNELSNITGLSEEYIENNEQKMETLSMLNSGYYFGLNNADELFLKESELIKDVAKKESCVIVGRCANFVLKDRKDITTVFIYSNMEDKIKRATTFYGLNKENAKKEIKRIDKLRANHYKYYTNNNWNDCSNYDICINSDTFGVEETAELICKMVSKKETKEV